MLELVNLSNCQSGVDLIGNDPDCLQAFLRRFGLAGVEMLFCLPWDEQLHKKEFIHGVHLKFWPCWLDFWRGDHGELLRQFGSEQNIRDYYGGLTKDAWLAAYRENLHIAGQAGAEYVVFHVSHARTAELFNWRFSATDREVVEAVVELVNELTDAIPRDMTLLFENLWWPGLTLKSKALTALLLEGVRHPQVGIMLDTGHLMNTNPFLKTEEEGVDYILATLSRLGEYRRYIKGIHLHRSLTGGYINDYIENDRGDPCREYTPAEVLNHVMAMDEHLPFSTPAVRRLVDFVQPDYLVHEFLQTSLADWACKIMLQQQALKGGRNR